jgi:peptidoglycan/xylan/chitin deacetylase (PgdA/CDA1 family)/predicted MFS family arabinose efflux permease
VAASTFRSLRVRNYRLYFTGQIISVSGTWMQSVAQAWLVVRYLAPHGQEGLDVGITTALQFLPMLLLGAWGGLVADRVDKQRLLFATQASAGMLALVLGLLVQLGHGPAGLARLWEVYVLALLLGVVNLFDNPARQTFVIEMVGKEDLPNAVSLNSIVMNGARVIGPALSGVLIATVGLAVCFEANAASYVAVIVALALMRRGELHSSERVERAKGQLREGLRYVWHNPRLRQPLVLVFVVGLFAYNFNVLLPLFARLTFRGNAATFSALTALMAGGAVVGGLVVASRGKPTVHRLTGVGIAFGIAIAAVALSPSLPVAYVLIVPMGALSISFIATANSTLQMRVEQKMRGRVMALYAIGFLGTAPIGAPLVGWISQAASPRVALLIGAASAVITSAAVLARHRRSTRPRRRRSEPVRRTGSSPPSRAPSSASPDRPAQYDRGVGAIGRLARLGAATAGAAALAQYLPSVCVLGQWSPVPVRSLPLGMCRWCGRAGQDAVALTFDDGPSPDSTPRTLELLDALGMRATFFVLGCLAEEHPELVEEIRKRGHGVASHGYAHEHHLLRTPSWIRRDLVRSVEVAEKAGWRPRWYRPSYGQLTATTVFEARRHGMEVVLWWAWGREWAESDPHAVMARLERRLDPGAIVLLHDTDVSCPPGTAALTHSTLELLGEQLASKGLRATALDELVL